MTNAFNGPGPDAVFAAALAEGRFMLQQCDECKKYVFYPRVLCPHCGSPELAWQFASGQGVVYSTTVVRRKPEQGGDYNVALVDLSEGPRMMSRVDGIPPHEVSIGLAVCAHIIDDPKKGKLLVFTPAQGGVA
ncbi:MAG: DNA-binding protein [Rugosibacter sp.]|nr:MAG: DNA-binding protein [Rugosibacter sp.]TBR10713.1 MAG: DNA-binding protein [Rugosibacter sp.]